MGCHKKRNHHRYSPEIAIFQVDSLNTIYDRLLMDIQRFRGIREVFKKAVSVTDTFRIINSLMELDNKKYLLEKLPPQVTDRFKMAEHCFHTFFDTEYAISDSAIVDKENKLSINIVESVLNMRNQASQMSSDLNAFRTDNSGAFRRDFAKEFYNSFVSFDSNETSLFNDLLKVESLMNKERHSFQKRILSEIKN